MLLSVLLVGCGADISAYQDREILVVGLAEEDFSVTPDTVDGFFQKEILGKLEAGV